MSIPKIYKENNVKSRQSVMGNCFSTSGQSKTPTNIKAKKKTNKPKKVKKGETVRESTQKDIEQTAVVNREEKSVQKASIKRKEMRAGLFSFSWTSGAQSDTETYRNGYPGKKDHTGLDNNYKFYMNQIRLKPNGNFIDNIHVEWWGDYKLLEVHHGYIQWLFPIRESGVNWHAQELQLHEIKNIQGNEKAMKRLLTSYKMMLDFYGMELENEDDGTIKRAHNWKERFRHLNRSGHNYLRITRILKSLGELGYEHLKKNFVKFVLYEGLEEGTLSNVIGSCVKYWIGVLKKDEEREEMFEYYYKLTDGENLSSKRRDTSSSPPSDYLSSLQADSKTGKTVISKQDCSTKDKSTKKTNEKIEDKEKLNNVISDDNDSAPCHLISHIDNDDETQKNSDIGDEDKDKRRNEHKMSDSDKEIEIKQDESQEILHLNNESVSANVEKMKYDNEYYNSYDNADVQGGDENKMTDTAERKPLSMINKESLVNDNVETNTGGQEARKTNGKEKVEVVCDDKICQNNVSKDFRCDEITLKTYL